MRAIDHKHVRRAAQLDALNAASVGVGTANEITWDEYLRCHADEASQLRTGLWTVGYMKCWFSEASLQQGEGHIEHFRPKGKLAGASHNGYKWRAFDWRNLRYAHGTVNLRRTDYLTRRKMGKGSYFPLQNPATRAVDASGENTEIPVLLDPVIPSDTMLLCFDEASGAPKARFEKDQNEWLNRRAIESIDYYHLNEGSWNAKRADLMSEVRKLCEQLLTLSTAHPIDEEAYNRKIDEIVPYLSPFAEFSSACLQVVQGLGMLEHFAPGL